VPTKIKLQLGL